MERKEKMNEQAFLDQLEKLVAFPTLSGNIEANSMALDYVESLLHPQVVVERYHNGAAEILMVSNRSTKEPDFGYLVHMDVVGAKPDQFAVKREGDKLMGRGVSDMKFSIPLGIALLNEMIVKKSEKTFSLVITTDEEIGGPEGGKYLAGELAWRPRAMIVPDGGDNFIFVEKAKGICQLLIEKKGIPSHASRTWDGENALSPLVKLANTLLERYEKQSSVEGWSTTMNIGQLHGGVSTNQVCDSAKLYLDFRYGEDDSIERIEQEVRSLADELGGEVSITKISTGLPTYTDQQLPVVRDFVEAIAKETKAKVEVKVTYGASDARYFAAYDTPVLMLKPTGGDIHCDTEWLSLSATMEYYQGLRRFVGLKG